MGNGSNQTTAWQTKLLWTAIAVLGAVSFGIVAINRGEAVNAAWLVVAAVCIYFIAYRFYGLFVAERALGVDGTRPTPPIVITTVSITSPPIATCSSVIILRPSQGLVHWLAPCLQHKWAICLARCGFLLARCLLARSRT